MIITIMTLVDYGYLYNKKASGSYIKYYCTVMLKSSCNISGTPEQTRHLIGFRADNEKQFTKNKYAAKQVWEGVTWQLYLLTNTVYKFMILVTMVSLIIFIICHRTLINNWALRARLPHSWCQKSGRTQKKKYKVKGSGVLKERTAA